ncbi:MAG: hypothetical protein E7Z91_02835 [Cyanobacteria bacterium SIG30]|nr:hypothetical protein [Cyanobacteria bacterium SIG30]
MKFLNKITKADLLITGIILSIIFVLALPLFNPKYESHSIMHGIFKCYFNEYGVLMQQNSTDKKYAEARPAEKGVCHFKAPRNANALEIILVGGGGGGSASQIAMGQRSLEFEPETFEIDLTSNHVVLSNPFDKSDVLDYEFENKLLKEFSFTVAGGGGGSVENSNALSGMGGICAYGGKDITINDEIIREPGQNGEKGENGKDGILKVVSQRKPELNLVAKAGLGVLHLDISPSKDGYCSDEKYSAGHFRNESSKGLKVQEPTNNAYYKNFPVTKLVAEIQSDKVKVLKGVAGKKGEVVSYRVKRFNETLNICSQKGNNCHALIGQGGKGGVVKNIDAQYYTDNLSGTNGGDTLFLKSVAKGGKGGSATPSDVSYIDSTSTILAGENGEFLEEFAQNGAMGGSCSKGSCDGHSARSLGASGSGAGLLYRSLERFRTAHVAKVLDSQNRQIGEEIKFTKKQAIDFSADERYMGNGGDGASGAIIIKW